MNDAPIVHPDWIKPRPQRISHSSAETYRQCPRKWRGQYLTHERVGNTLSAILGQFVHSVLEHLYSANPSERTQDKAREIAADRWKELQEDKWFKEHDLDHEAQVSFKQRAWTSVQNIWSIEEPCEVEVIACEAEIDMVLAGVPIKGMIDRIDSRVDGIEIVDFKNGKLDKRYVKDKWEQLYIYAAMVKETMGLRPSSARLVFTSAGEDFRASVTGAQINPAVERLQETWVQINKSMDEDDFDAITGPLCAWCDFVAECPEGTDKVLNDIIPSGRMRDDAPAWSLLGLRTGEAAAPPTGG